MQTSGTANMMSLNPSSYTCFGMKIIDGWLLMVDINQYKIMIIFAGQY